EDGIIVLRGRRWLRTRWSQCRGWASGTGRRPGQSVNPALKLVLKVEGRLGPLFLLRHQT
ncbi:MAG TPA: hypothetical protein PKC45_04080, partial [Gemmatales bacterium]|nr:hypothetical protein [Gemmatales bacterium]